MSEQNRTVVALVFDSPKISETSKVLLVKKKAGWVYPKGREPFFRKSKFGLPGGRPKVPAETEHDNVEREVKEETGIKIEVLPGIRAQMGKGDFVKIGVVGYSIPGGELAANPQEIVECDWYPVSVLTRNSVNQLDFYKWQKKMATLLLKEISRQGLTQFQ